MSFYQIEWNIPYEGIEQAWCDTLEEVKVWIKNSGIKKYDLTVLEVTREIDVFELMKET